MNIIDIKDLHKSYGKHPVLKGIHFQAKPGEIIGIIGKNGAGKSTLLEIIMTIKGFDHGKVSLFNQDLQNISDRQLEEIRSDISAVLQPTQFYKNLKVEELLKLFKAYYQSDMDIKKVMADFKLEPHRKTYFEKLSGGWKQKVSLAIAFISKPKLIVLDEPTTGLDPHMRNMLWAYITEYNQKTGGTVILTTHYMDEIEMYCDKVMLLNEGRNEVFDTPDQILSSTGFQSINEFYLKNVSI
ncbi:ABC transporter ATP-binding protein [Bacillus niameyensis]|uniref:ABC transporter ATP-binding protein n=1 Tax=Bacillus niameyensis TaxID=1522308 RepID=UPI00078633C9|nr:ABC transporter ATP-binding protein [Bacillus niameyensis]